MKITSLLLMLTSAWLMAPALGDPPADSGLELIDPALFGFGPPGFGTQVTASAPLDFSGGGGALEWVDGRARVPLWAHDFGGGNLLGASLSYSWDALDLQGTAGLGSLSLQAPELQFGWAHFPKSRTGWMGLAIVAAGVGSDFREVNGDDFSFSAVTVFGYQYSPRFTLAVAGIYQHSIGETIAIPGVGFIWKPNEQWLVQATPPVLALGWTPAPEWRWSLSAYPSGGAWDVDGLGKAGEIEAIKLETWRAGLGLERRWGPNWRMTAQVGLNFAGKIELRDAQERVVVGRDLESSLFGLLGIAWTF